MPDQPWFKFFAADYLLDSKVDAMPREAEGLLIRMWCLCALEGSCPADPEELARRTLCQLNYVLNYQRYYEPFFDLRDGRLYSHRMEEEKRRSDQARANVSKRYKKRSSAIGSTTRSTDRSSDGSSNGTTQSQSQSQSESPLPPFDRKQPRQVEETSGENVNGNVKSNPTTFNPTEVAIALCQQEGWSGKTIPWALADAITHVADGSPSPDLKAIGEELVRLWQEHRATKQFPQDPGTFFSGAHYEAPAPAPHTGPPLITDPVKFAADLLAEDERHNKLLRARGKEALP